MPIVFRQKSVGLNGFSYCENVYRYSILFLMLTESNSISFLSEIIANNPEKLLIKT